MKDEPDEDAGEQECCFNPSLLVQRLASRDVLKGNAECHRLPDESSTIVKIITVRYRGIDHAAAAMKKTTLGIL
eukprot:scaffold11457_cov59-Cylindrotheca_fusiformis.AAC.1